MPTMKKYSPLMFTSSWRVNTGWPGRPLTSIVSACAPTGSRNSDTKRWLTSMAALLPLILMLAWSGMSWPKMRTIEPDKGMFCFTRPLTSCASRARRWSSVKPSASSLLWLMSCSLALRHSSSVYRRTVRVWVSSACPPWP
ncbi:hypothetical protein FQZ97_882670 [compost metagenome]